MLLDNFFVVESCLSENNMVKYGVKLNKDHFIYKAHFENNPITPGACILQMIKELLISYFKREFFFHEAKNIKYLNLLIPNDETIDFTLECVSINEKLLSVKVLVSDTKCSYAKFQLIYSSEPLKDSIL